jgi:hypothetical protein
MYDQVLTFNKTGIIRLNITVTHVRETIFAVGKQYYKFRMCVCSLRYSACKALTPFYTYIFCGEEKTN